MKYKLKDEIGLACRKVPKGTVIESIGSDDYHGQKLVAFVYESVHYLMPTDIFNKYFEEVES